MPLIKSKKAEDVQVRVRLRKDVLDEINKYREWAQIDDLGTFLEEAALYVLEKDKEWKQFSKSASKKPANNKE